MLETSDDMRKGINIIAENHAKDETHLHLPVK